MIRRIAGLAMLLLTLQVLTPRPVAAQGGTMLAMASPTMGHSNVAEGAVPAGCWDCVRIEVWGGYIDYCHGGYMVGFWNCWDVGGYCSRSSPGCGGGAALQVDADGATQYVSIGAMQEVIAQGTSGGSVVQRNCDGLIVARIQTPDDIVQVRGRTGVLSL